MTPAEALAALDRWAAILQVPDVRQAVEVLRREVERDGRPLREPAR